MHGNVTPSLHVATGLTCRPWHYFSVMFPFFFSSGSRRAALALDTCPAESASQPGTCGGFAELQLGLPFLAALARRGEQGFNACGAPLALMKRPRKLKSQTGLVASKAALPVSRIQYPKRVGRGVHPSHELDFIDQRHGWRCRFCRRCLKPHSREAAWFRLSRVCRRA